MKKIYLAILLFNLGICNLIYSQNLLGIYEFSGTGACPNQNPNVTTQPSDGLFSAFENVNINCSSAGGVFNNSSWNNTPDLNLNEYISFSFSSLGCFRADLDSLTFRFRTSGTGGTPTIYVRSNTDGYSTNLFSSSFSYINDNTYFTASVPLTIAEFQNLLGIQFRIYLTNIATSQATFRVDDVALYGDMLSSAPEDFFQDTDNDGYGAGTATSMCNNPGGFVNNNQDCNDADSLVNPFTLWYQDNDADGFGDDAITEIACTSALTNPVLIGGDCIDFASDLNPNTIWYEDADGDFFGNDANTQTGCTHTFTSASNVGGDCMDDLASVYPDAPEICDEFDNNCNGETNEGLTTTVYFIDNDGDGFGAGSAGDFCSDPGIGYTSNNTDCNDDDFSTYLFDTLFVDIDGDGYDGGTATICFGIEIPAGYSANTIGSDCDDNNDLTFQSDLLYIDMDVDGFDNGNETVCFGANLPTGYSEASNGNDCDDTNASINPNATDIGGDGIDQNCDAVDGYLGLNENEEMVFSIAPNPGQNYIVIHSKLTSGSTINLVNANGNSVIKVEVTKSVTTINTENIAAGIYFVHVNTNDKIAIKKWVKL